MKRIKKFQFILLLSATMIALPLLMAPISGEPAAVVERNKVNGYFFKIQGHNLPQAGYGVVDVIYKNLSPKTHTIIMELNGVSKDPVTVLGGIEAYFPTVLRADFGAIVICRLYINDGTNAFTIEGTIKIPPT